MSALTGRTVFVADRLSYDARGGTGTVYGTLEDAMAAHADVSRWVLWATIGEGYSHWSLTEACPADSTYDLTEIRAEVVQ